MGLSILRQRERMVIYKKLLFAERLEFTFVTGPWNIYNHIALVWWLIVQGQYKQLHGDTLPESNLHNGAWLQEKHISEWAMLQSDCSRYRAERSYMRSLLRWRHLHAKTLNWDYYTSSPSSHALSPSVNANGSRSLKNINLPKEVAADTISQGHQVQQKNLTEGKKMTLLIRDKMKVRVRGLNDKHSASSMLSPISRSRSKQANKTSLCYNSAMATSIPSLTPNSSSLSSFDQQNEYKQRLVIYHDRQAMYQLCSNIRTQFYIQKNAFEFEWVHFS